MRGPAAGTGCMDETVRVWDPATGTPLGDPLTGHTAPVTAAAAFTGPDGRTLLATGSRDETVRVWDPATGTPLGDPLTGHTDQGTAAAAFTGRGGRTLLATGSDDETVRVWNLTTGGHEYTIRMDSPVTALASVDGGIAVGCGDGLLVTDVNL